MTRLIDATGTVSLAALATAMAALTPTPALAQKAAEAELRLVDAQSDRISDRVVGYLRFTKGKGEHEVDILVQIRDLSEVQGEQPLMAPSGYAVYRHGLRIRRGDCTDLKAGDSRDGVLPDVGVRQDGNATLTITADGISMSELPGKSVVLYRGPGDAKRQIVACGMIKGS